MPNNYKNARERVPWFSNMSQRLHATLLAINMTLVLITGILWAVNVLPFLLPAVLCPSVVLWLVRGAVYVMWDK